MKKKMSQLQRLGIGATTLSLVTTAIFVGQTGDVEAADRNIDNFSISDMTDRQLDYIQGDSLIGGFAEGTFNVMSKANTALNVRSGPGSSHDVIGSIPRGAVVQGSLPFENDKWMKVAVDGEVGYASAELLQGVSEVTEVRAESDANSSLNIRSGPGTEHRVVGSLPRGEVVTGSLPIENDNWMKVEFEGQTAYASTNLLKEYTHGDSFYVESLANSSLNVRSGPGTDYDVVESLPSGAIAEAKFPLIDGKWLEVEVDGTTGYASATLLKESYGVQTFTLESTANSASNVRSGPGSSHGVVGSILAGTTVEAELPIIDDNWVKVKGDGFEGYTSLRVAEPEQVTAPVDVESIANNALNVRSGPSMDDDVVGSIPRGDIVEGSFPVKNDTWLSVEGDGFEGYASTNLLASPTEAPWIDVRSEANSELNVRSGPGMDYSVVDSIPRGDVVSGALPLIDDQWMKVYDGEELGYASYNLLDAVDTTSVEGDSLDGMHIVLDPGHGGSDPGAVFGGLREKDLVMETSLPLVDELESRGAEVTLTRDSDRFVSLADRVNLSEQEEADIFLSIHANAGGGSGSETYYNDYTFGGAQNPYPEASRNLATSIQDEMAELPIFDRGVKTSAFYVLRNNSAPAVLVETAFVDSPTDAAYLREDSFHENMAGRIADGVENYAD